MSEKDKISKYNAISGAKYRENALRKYVMMAKGKLEKACAAHHTTEDMTGEEFLTSAETKEKVIDIMKRLEDLNMRILHSHNDILIATYLNVTHWWYELCDDMLEYICQTEDWYVYSPVQIEEALGLVEHYLQEANNAQDKLKEWNKPFLFEKYL